MTDTLRLDGPVEILVTLGLTLPSISDAELDGIRHAAPTGSTVRVAETMGQRSCGLQLGGDSLGIETVAPQKAR